ncbi:ESF1 homolog isoform X2 [Pseudoliparis swirei]|uniref:ESF1 homolog isoform X2 n=1 Tax=Pseudoliparis swirei TaxID=2059687 RepID=UPI0024BEC6A3|nr:ESF1 homolog isoform X2 [Pseudoliparis swirei]
MSSKKQPGGDDRFLRVQKDPRFWEMPERDHKIKIDKRFQSMFHDKRFKQKYTVDKRGRPINQTSAEDLKRFYKLSDSEDEDDEDGGKGKKAADGKEKKKGKEKVGKEKVVKEKVVKEEVVKEEVVKKMLLLTADGEAKRRAAEGQLPKRGIQFVEEEDGDDEEEEEEEEELQTAEEDYVDLKDGVTGDSEDEEDDNDDDAEDESGSGDEEEEEEEESGLDSDSDSEPDLARGKGNVETSSDEDEVDVDAVLKKEEEEIEHDWGEMAKDARRSDEVSTRLAVCNMDWDRIKAKDLLALINSFVPKEGAVLSVKVYPSEFGKERLKAEETKGPLELRALPDDSEEDTEEERGYRERMRDYQFKRLKYFYAVVECDSPDTADKVYQECDGYEYESSCSVLDLRFIPDEVTFDGEEPRDVATDVNLSAYTPKLFTTTANATSKVQLTWDETDNDRVSTLNRKFNKDELLAMDFNAYLASSSEEEEEGEEAGFVFGEQEREDDAEEVAAQRAEEPVVENKSQKKKEEKKKKSEEQISKYRELLKGIRVKEKKLQEDDDVDMEITWAPGLKEATEQLVKKKLEGADQPTPWEEFLQKKKDRKKQKKPRRKEEEEEEELSDEDLPPDVDLSDPYFAEELAATDTKKKPKWKKKKKPEEEERTAEEEEELEKQKAQMALLMDDGDEAEHKHFNYDKIVEEQNLSKKKRKKLLRKSDAPPEGDDFQVDVKDPRFQAMFTSHLFNLDPSNPSYKKTKATQSFQAEKQRRRGERKEAEPEDATAAGKRESDSGAPTDSGAARKSMDAGLSLLVKSIKSKTEQFQARKKQKFV